MALVNLEVKMNTKINLYPKIVGHLKRNGCKLQREARSDDSLAAPDFEIWRSADGMQPFLLDKQVHLKHTGNLVCKGAKLAPMFTEGD